MPPVDEAPVCPRAAVERIGVVGTETTRELRLLGLLYPSRLQALIRRISVVLRVVVRCLPETIGQDPKALPRSLSTTSIFSTANPLPTFLHLFPPFQSLTVPLSLSLSNCNLILLQRVTLSASSPAAARMRRPSPVSRPPPPRRLPSPRSVARTDGVEVIAVLVFAVFPQLRPVCRPDRLDRGERLEMAGNHRLPCLPPTSNKWMVSPEFSTRYDHLVAFLQIRRREKTASGLQAHLRHQRPAPPSDWERLPRSRRRAP